MHNKKDLKNIIIIKAWLDGVINEVTAMNALTLRKRSLTKNQKYIGKLIRHVKENDVYYTNMLINKFQGGL
jgi:hypothetical protein